MVQNPDLGSFSTQLFHYYKYLIKDRKVNGWWFVYHMNRISGELANCFNLCLASGPEGVLNRPTKTHALSMCHMPQHFLHTLTCPNVWFTCLRQSGLLFFVKLSFFVRFWTLNKVKCSKHMKITSLNPEFVFCDHMKCVPASFLAQFVKLVPFLLRGWLCYAWMVI